MERRTFLSSLAAAAVAPTLAWRTADAAPAALPEVAAGPFEAFAPGTVTLGPGLCAAAFARNQRYLHSLPVDRLLHTFRTTAGLASTAQPLGGWEKPDCELRGHFSGHYLSACALMSAYHRDDELRQRGAGMVGALAECQRKVGSGYLSAYPEELYDRLKNGVRVWAPFYTYHKVLAGHIDQYTLTGNTDALAVAERMAGWVRHWLNGVSDAHMQRILQTEYGGMNEGLYNLAAVTGKEEYLDLGHRFAQPSFFDPLSAHRDELKGLHVNTQIPKVIGAARRYELTGDRRYRDIAEFFWQTVVEDRSYAVGNTSCGELWRTAPRVLASELSADTAECCCAYNLMKLTRHLFTWTGDAKYADYYERALFNCRLGTQHPDEGWLMYYLPLAAGYWKRYGGALDAFWCCTGTGVEEYARLADSIYFQAGNALVVNLFVPSEVDWRAQGVKVRQEANFPEEERVRFIVSSDRPRAFTIRVRVPYWVTDGGSASLNGAPLGAFASPSSYLAITRTWHPGDTLEVRLPMRLHRAPLPDDRRIQALMYGPLVLAGRLGREGITAEMQVGDNDARMKAAGPAARPLDAPVEGEPSFVEPVAGQPLVFRSAGQAKAMELVPLHRIHGERYAVYFEMRG